MRRSFGWVVLLALLVVGYAAATDLYHDAEVSESSAYTGKVAASYGTSVDLGSGNPYGSALFLFNFGVYADSAHSGKYVFTIEESNDDTTFTTAAAASMIGTPPTLVDSADGSQIYQVQYKRQKRYVRPAWSVVGESSDTTALSFSVFIMKLDPKYRPAR